MFVKCEPIEFCDFDQVNWNAVYSDRQLLSQRLWTADEIVHFLGSPDQQFLHITGGSVPLFAKKRVHEAEASNPSLEERRNQHQPTSCSVVDSSEVDWRNELRLGSGSWHVDAGKPMLTYEPTTNQVYLRLAPAIRSQPFDDDMQSCLDRLGLETDCFLKSIGELGIMTLNRWNEVGPRSFTDRSRVKTLRRIGMARYELGCCQILHPFGCIMKLEVDRSDVGQIAYFMAQAMSESALKFDKKVSGKAWIGFHQYQPDEKQFVTFANRRTGVIETLKLPGGVRWIEFLTKENPGVVSAVKRARDLEFAQGFIPELIVADDDQCISEFEQHMASNFVQAFDQYETDGGLSCRTTLLYLREATATLSTSLSPEFARLASLAGLLVQQMRKTRGLRKNNRHLESLRAAFCRFLDDQKSKRRS